MKQQYRKNVKKTTKKMFSTRTKPVIIHKYNRKKTKLNKKIPSRRKKLIVINVFKKLQKS